VRLQGSGPALAPRRTELRPRCDLNGWLRPRLGQLPRGDARQGDLPTCDRPPGGHVLLALVIQINPARAFAPRPNPAVDILAAPEPCYFSGGATRRR
jgi:hypothetical protein